MAILNLQIFLTTANGRICCLRCTAQSTRTKEQCGRPALKISKTQKCQFHGGRSPGPVTKEGRQNIAKAQFIHGESSKKSRLEYSKSSARLSRLEDAMYLLNMTSAPRTRGRKSQFYLPLRSINDIKKMILDTELHHDRGSFEAL